MKNEDIYKAALHLVGELNSEQTSWNADYLERSGYLLAMVCRQCEPVENLYRAANGQEAVTLPDQLCYLMTVTFPLSPPLSTAAAFGLAALLVAVISVIVWSVVGSLPQTMTVKGVTVGGNVINCYECVENANTNLIGCKANITLPDGRNISGKVEAVSQNPYSQEEIRAEISEDWLADNVLDGNYSYEVRVIAEEDIPSNMLATVIITTAEMKPIQFILD